MSNEVLYKTALESIVDICLNKVSGDIRSEVFRLARYALDSAPHEVTRINNIKAKAKEALAATEKTGTWTELALLGLFYKLYELEIGTPYTLISSKPREDLAHVKILFQTLGDLAVFAIQAFFSPAMKWVVNKRLDFFSADNVERFVRPVAAATAQKDRRSPEWATGTKARGLVSSPKG